MIRGPILLWISNCLTQRKMCVVVEGEKSCHVEVGSGVPQGTVLGPLLFLCHINDLPEHVDSQICLFTDDSLLYRPINSMKDHQILEQDLNNLQKWATDWGMKFNAKKCYLLSSKIKGQCNPWTKSLGPLDLGLVQVGLHWCNPWTSYLLDQTYTGTLGN